MSWAAVMLFGSGLIFSTGLVWFFVQAWIFAIQAQTVWLIILLTVTTMVAVVSQGYLCAIFVSIPSSGEEDDLIVILMSLHDSQATGRVVFYDPKPRGVTQINREAFASFPFDATASLVRRKGSGTRPPVGWEVKSSQQLAASLRHPDPGAPGATPPFGRDASGGCQAGAPAAGQAQRRSGGGDIAGCRKVVPAGAGAVGSMETRECKAAAGAVRSPKSGDTLHMLAPPSDIGLVGRGGARGVFGTARIASSEAGATAAATEEGQCVEDVVESGHAGPVLLLGRTKTKPLSPGPSHFTGGPHAHGENGEKHLEVGDLGESLGKHDHLSACHRHRHRHRRHFHQHLSQEMKVCSSWTGSAQTDAPSIGSDDDNDDTAVRLRCGSGGSNCCSETAHVDSKACAKGAATLFVTEQQLATEVEAEVLPLSPLAEQQTSAAAVSTVVSGADGSARANDETVVRVSELPDVCAICLGQYATGEEVHVLPCLHIFHAECLDVWIRGHPSCPYCKGDLNVIPQENNSSPETTAICFACSVLSGMVSFVTGSFVRFFRGFWERRRQQREQTAEGGGDREEAGEGNEAAEGVVNFAPPALDSSAATPVPPSVVAA
ncbi:unnamed protein product [Ectocarpus sp. 12 AP-2014]